MSVPRIWARIIPWDKEAAVTAIESGVEALWLPDGCVELARALGRVTTVCGDGDIREGTDFRATRMERKEDEERIAGSPPDAVWVVFPGEGELIPLEHLVALGRRVLVVAKTRRRSRFTGACWSGAFTAWSSIARSLGDPRDGRGLPGPRGRRCPRPARVTEVASLGMGDRVCVDTCTWIEGSRGLLVGNSSAGLFLVCAENVPNPYVLPRPFRVNAGAVHSYCRVPGGAPPTCPTSRPGPACWCGRREGQGEIAYVGRVKVERRPLLLVRAPSRPATSIPSCCRTPKRSGLWGREASRRRSPGSGGGRGAVDGGARGKAFRGCGRGNDQGKITVYAVRRGG